ncbi:MAG: hypothetical protein HY271_20225 [Deltaproteobacteria bacterium]|nr:hypothetical protein [Deltaproteobacteria bacterium]
MKWQSTCLALALVATFAIAGCGQDNSRHENDNISATSTPVRTNTPTPIVTSVPPTLTPASPGGTGPTPTPSGTVCESDHMTLTITSAAGSDLSTGWTGISHHKPAIEQTQVTVNLDCTGNDCVVDGAALKGQNFGSPLPLAAGGVAVCVLNTFREGVTGTYNCASGCGESATQLTSAVFQSQVLEKPCPLCVGDATPNDGVKGGTCDSGTGKGAACDVGGISPDFGSTSNDCLPSGSDIGKLTIDITPLTTGTVTQTASLTCGSSRFGNTCFCPGQDRPDACIAPSPEGTCPASGICDDPVDGNCSTQTFRVCDLGTGTEQCDQAFPGSGECQVFSRPCFSDTISRTGQCGTQNGTLVGFFCIPATTAPAINTVSGLPGPGVVSLPVSSVRRPR